MDPGTSYATTVKIFRCPAYRNCMRFCGKALAESGKITARNNGNRDCRLPNENFLRSQMWPQRRGY